MNGFSNRLQEIPKIPFDFDGPVFKRRQLMYAHMYFSLPTVMTGIDPFLGPIIIIRNCPHQVETETTIE